MLGPRLLPSTLTRLLATTYARAAATTLAAVVAIVLVIDFADRAYSFEGPGWVLNVVRLYANLSLDIAYQVAPSALLLAAGVAVSGLRRTGELTALWSLGVAPRRVIITMLGSCAVACGLLAVLNEWVVVDAARRADEIRLERLHRAGDLRTYFSEQRWFRGEGRIYHLRGSQGDAFVGVTIYELGPGFRLLRRIDADRMEPSTGGSWRMIDADVSTFFQGGRVSLVHEPDLELRLPESPEDFRVRVGRPRQFTMWELVDQIAVRRRLGLDVSEWRLELHGRLAYPFAAVPGAFLAVLLALRPNRKGHLTTALAEGILVSLVMWSLLIVFRAMGISGKLDPAVAAWLPLLLLGLVGAAASLGSRRGASQPVAEVVPA